MTKSDLDLLETIKELEIQLHSINTRADSAALNSLIHNDFREIGSSGRSFDKAVVLESLPKEARNDNPLVIKSEDFRLTKLSETVVLLNYTTVKQYGKEPGDKALRSSIWKYQDGRWQMLFHQGTPTKS